MAVHQVLAAARPGDPVAAAALALRDVLRGWGPSEVFVAKDALPGEKAVWVLHAGGPDLSTGSLPDGARGLVVLVFHGLCEPGRFAAIDRGPARLVEAARTSLVALRPRVSRAIAATGVAAGQLRDLGYEEVEVGFPYDPSPVASAEPEPSTAHHLATRFEGPVVLFSGELMPCERVEDVLGAYNVLTTHLNPDARLVVAGCGPDGLYAGAVQRLIDELNLAGAWVSRGATTERLAAFARRACCVLAMGEGPSCPRLVEAMACGLPVIARGAGAAPETVGAGGLLLPVDTGIHLAAEAVAAVLADAGLRRGLAVLARRRMGELDLAGARERLAGSLAEAAR